MSTIVRGRRSRPLAPRAVRMRNACVQHAAERLGLPVPGAGDLSALADDASLRDAVAWWQARAPGAVGASRSRPRGRLVLKTGLITAVTLLGLAFSYGRVQ
jgi:hypothetical protein